MNKRGEAPLKVQQAPLDPEGGGPVLGALCSFLLALDDGRAQILQAGACVYGLLAVNAKELHVRAGLTKRQKRGRTTHFVYLSLDELSIRQGGDELQYGLELASRVVRIIGIRSGEYHQAEETLANVSVSLGNKRKRGKKIAKILDDSRLPVTCSCLIHQIGADEAGRCPSSSHLTCIANT